MTDCKYRNRCRAVSVTGVLLWAAFAMLSPGRAQEQPPTQLSLADAVGRALDNNPNLVRSQESYRTSRSRLRIAGFQTTLDIGGDTSLDREPGDSSLSSRLFGSLTYENFLGTQGSIELAPFGLGNNRGSLALALRHPLISGKGRLSSKGFALVERQSDVRVVDKELFLSRQATVLGVINAYFGAVRAKEQVKVQERALEIADSEAKRASRLAEEGRIAPIEVTRAEIRAAQSRDQLNLQQQSARAATDRLMIAIGEGVGQTPDLTDSVPEVVYDDIPQLAEAVKAALKNRSELAIYDEQLFTQELALERTSDELRPKLDVVAGFNSINNRSGAISTSLFESGSLTAGLQLRLPLDKRIIIEERETAARNLDVLRRLREFEMEQIAQDVREAYRAIDSAQTSIQILGQNLDVATENLRLAQKMVEEGLSDNRNVLEAQEELTRVETGVLQAKIEFYLASVNLKHAMGADLTSVGL